MQFRSCGWLSSGLVFLASLWAGAVSLTAAPAEEFLLRNGDRPVVFLGDSITAQLGYTIHIESYVQTRFPAWNISFRNVGIGSDTALLRMRGGQTNGLARDVYPLKPAVVTIDFGMNDARSNTVWPMATSEQGLPYYVTNQTALVRSLQRAGARVILISPTPEEKKQSGEPGGSAYNRVLEKYSAALRQVAKDTGVPFIDQFHPFLNVLEAGRTANLPDFKLVPDGIHPNRGGHLIMAWAILKGMHAPAEVSRVTFDGAAGRLVEAQGCKITGVQLQNGTLSFVRLDDCLPWFVHNDVRFVLAVPGFDPLADLSAYMLTVSRLPPDAQYRLVIDGAVCGPYTGAQLAAGVNLSLNAGPITDQAGKLYTEVFRKTWAQHQYFTKYIRTPAPPGQIAGTNKVARERDMALLTQAVAAGERAIETLRQPKPHKFDLIPIAPPPAKK